MGRHATPARGTRDFLPATKTFIDQKFNLQVSSTSSGMHEQLLDMVEALSMYLPLVQDWTEIFPPSDHAELARNLKKTCSAFVEFLVEAILFFRRSSLGKTAT